MLDTLAGPGLSNRTLLHSTALNHARVMLYGGLTIGRFLRNALKHAAAKHGVRGVHPEPGPVLRRRHRHDQGG